MSLHDEYSEYDSLSQDNLEHQVRRVHRNVGHMLPSDLASPSKKTKRKSGASFVVEKYILYVAKGKYYFVQINLRGLRVNKAGFKSLESAREFRDAQLAGYIAPPIKYYRGGSRATQPAIYIKP